MSMLFDIFPFQFHFDAKLIAGATLWSLALYWGFSPVSAWVTHQLNRWFNYAEKMLYTSEAEYERTRQARESQNAFYASLFSIVPFLIMGALCNWGIEIGLDKSWSISVGIIVCISGGVYELGRQDGKKGINS